MYGLWRICGWAKVILIFMLQSLHHVSLKFVLPGPVAMRDDLAFLSHRKSVSLLQANHSLPLDCTLRVGYALIQREQIIVITCPTAYYPACIYGNTQPETNLPASEHKKATPSAMSCGEAVARSRQATPWSH